ncbi:MAG: tetratricopeptide repeat protein [Azospirillaceae bacterium]|nr:tetratricopeptide repeat protein [Azospirillaceae bacterium]
MRFKEIICPSCQKLIPIPNDISSLECPYCKFLIKESAAPGATISTLLGLARTAIAAGNMVEALDYFNRVLESDPTNAEAWFGKGKAAGWQSTIANIRLPEMLIAFNHAISNANDERKESVVLEAIDEANRIIVAIYGMARKHMLEYVSLNNSWPAYVQQVANLVDCLSQLSSIMPLSKTTHENIVYLCKDNIEGVKYRDKFNNNYAKSWTLTPQYEEKLRSIMEVSVGSLRKIDPEYEPPVIEKNVADACFVITATMGDANDPTVIFMRLFRDEWLLSRKWGRLFIDLYYCYGPKLANFIAKKHIRQKVAFILIVKPADWIAHKLLKI